MSVTLSLGDSFTHDRFGDVEVTDLLTSYDAVDIDSNHWDDEPEVHIGTGSGWEEFVKFTDADGSEHMSPLEEFVRDVGLNVGE